VTTGRQIEAGAQRRALSRAFLERFFENEITGRGTDLRSSFFWLIGLLGAPGVFMAVIMSWAWEGVFIARGFDAVDRAAWPDKALYLGLSIVVTGVIVSIVWNALLLDRRDAAILGVLPIKPRTILRAKLGALAVYVLVMSVGMHIAASVTFGAILGNHGSLAFIIRNIVAHLGAATLASVFVFVTLCALQALALVSLGPRLFSRFSPLLQTLLVAVVILALLILPTVVAALPPTLEQAGIEPLADSRRLSGSSGVTARMDLDTRVKPWILNTPILWFLGLYEWILGTADPVLARLARTAVLMTGFAAVVLLVAYPLAYRRTLGDTLGGPARVSMLARLAALMLRVLARSPQTRASMQFFLATAGRVDRHRLTMALACGAAAALALPSFLESRAAAGGGVAVASTEWMSIPLVVILMVTVGLRMTASLPSELQSSWLFASIDPDPRRARTGIFRVIASCLVAPVALAAAAFAWGRMDPQTAVAFGLICLAAGLLLTEALLYTFSGMPCSRPWSPEGVSLRKLWPFYLFFFLAFTRGLPWLARQVGSDRTAIAVTLSIAALAGVALHVWGRARRHDDDYEIDVLPHVSVLDIE
jgi:hypothetical protein